MATKKTSQEIDYSFAICNNYNVKFEYYHYSKYWVERKVKLIINDACWGELTITGHPFNYSLGEIVNNISIWVDRPYQRLGFSRVLIKSMIESIYKMESDAKTSHKLYIDPDLAFGFWKYVGVNTEVTATNAFHRSKIFTTIENLKRFVD